MGDASKVITVMSPKGGAGKTTVATHLAVALARRRQDDVAIVDLDLAFGDVTNSLLLAPRRDILDAIAATVARDPEALAATLARHPSGLRVLAAPTAVVEDPDELAAGAAEVLDALATRFEHVVVDTGAGLDRVTMAALRRATDVVVVASMDVPTLLALRKALHWLDRDGVAARRHVVLNRGDLRAGLTIDDVEATIGAAVDLSIPSSGDVARATNDGMPLEDGPVAGALARLVDELCGDVPEATSRWRFGRRGGSPRR